MAAQVSSADFRKVAFGLVAVLLCLTIFVSVERYLFLKRSVLVEAQVSAAELLEGPPKRPGAKRITLIYNAPSGESITTETRTPFLSFLDKGQTVRIWVDPGNPKRFFFHSWADLWGLPSIMGIFAVLVGVLTIAVGTVKRT